MRFVGCLEVTGGCFEDSTPIWKDAVFPCRVPVKPIVTLTPETGVPVKDLQASLSFFQDLKTQNRWSGPFPRFSHSLEGGRWRGCRCRFAPG